MDQGTLIMSGLKKHRVMEAIRVVTSQHDRAHRVGGIVPDYLGGAVSKQIVKIVLSYTDYVNRTVWSR